MTIYGAGVIGCEYASIFLNMGAKVTLVNTQDRLLSFLDDEIAEALVLSPARPGLHHPAQRAVRAPRGARARCGAAPEIRRASIKSDLLLWANGRTGNTDGLELEAIGLKPNQRGQIEVNEHYQTAVPHVYAVGDVIGPPALASAAYEQGRYAGQHILDPAIALAARRPHSQRHLHHPGDLVGGRAPSASCSRRTFPTKSGTRHFKSLARAQMTGQRVGMLKLLFHRETLQLLGVHCFGDNASEIVHIGQTVMASSDLNNLRYFINTTFNYPTMAEAYRIAAYNGLNRLA